MYDQIAEVIDKISYLRVTTESTGGWNKHKTNQTVKGNQTLAAIDKCFNKNIWYESEDLANVYVSRGSCRKWKYGVEPLQNGEEKASFIFLQFCLVAQY